MLTVNDTVRAFRRIQRRLRNTESTSPPIYVQDVYTPTYLGQTTPGVTTYTTQAGFYTRIGRVIFFNGFIVWTAATGTGNANISLPFTSDSTANMRYAMSVSTENVTYAGSGVTGRIAPGQSVFNLASPASNAASTIVIIEAAGSIIFGGFFYVT